jgi:probable HAF family extracellular repeat protein
VSILALSSNAFAAQVHHTTIAPGRAPIPAYTILDLSIGSPFPDALAYGISQNGKITGAGTDPNTNELHAFIYQAGAFQDLGDLGYAYGANGVGINDNGQMLGLGYGAGYRAILYSNGSVTTIGGQFSEGFSINNLGDVVGRFRNDDGNFQGFTYINGQFTQIPVLTYVYIVRSINDSDQFVGSLGYYWSHGGYVHMAGHAFLDSGGVITDLGSIGGGPETYTEAFGINNAGQVTGYSTAADGTQHAFVYTGGAMNDCGTIAPYYTCGVSINDSGTVAGNITTYVGGQVGVFVYSNGTMRNLSDLVGLSGGGWSQLTAYQMNNDGWIVGYGTINGATHGFLARPQ